MKHKRPSSIIWFERLYWISFATAFVDGIAMWDQQITTMDADFETPGFARAILIAGWILAFALSAVIWFFVAVKAKRWAKWVQVVFACFATISVIVEIIVVFVNFSSVPEEFGLNFSDLVLPDHLNAFAFFSTFLNMVASCLLFRKDAVSWFETKPTSYDEVFD